MSEHRATVAWRRTSDSFDYDAYNRDHEWTFEGGVRVPASSAPDFRGDAERVDPEKALVAALSGCHMLTFLAVCARKRLVVDSYDDEAVGYLEKNAEGKLAVTRVVLRPRVSFGGDGPPPDDELAQLHAKAHHNCFIANSVRTEVTVEPADAAQ
jgi:organic hydroperoxide reductase OsmC/OhrA